MAAAALPRISFGAEREPFTRMARSALYFDVGPIVAARYFLMPVAARVFPGNGAGFARHVLFRGGALRCVPGRFVRRKCFGKRAVDLISPAAVVLDDAINDLGHGAGFPPGYVSQAYAWQGVPLGK